MSALDGVRVVDFGQWIAGPLAAMLVGDQGAEVSHVDPPGGPRWKSPANATFNRGKASVDLDLKTDQGRAHVWHLIDAADVLIENFRPGVMERLAIGSTGLLVNGKPEGGRPDDPWAGIFRCADGRWIRLSLATFRFLERFVDAVGKPDWIAKGYVQRERPGPLARGTELRERQQAE